MCDAQGIKVCIKGSVLEFSAIITFDVFYLGAKIVHSMIGEASEDILHFSLVKDYVHPTISRVIINNNEAIKMCGSSKGRVVSRAKEVHVKQLRGT